MYLYAFTLYAGNDRVFKYDSIATKLTFSSGDLIQIQEQYFLVLWETLSFQEQYTSVPLMSGVVQIIHKNLLSDKTMQLIHRMSYQRYSPYKAVIKYFLPKEIATLLKKSPKKFTKTKKSAKTSTQSSISSYQLTILDQEYTLSDQGQTLMVFPDVWTLYNTIPENVLAKENIAVLHSSSTQNQKDKTWRGLKTWSLHVLLTTHAQIFQDFYNLKTIIQIAPHKRYYANQQDPRYKTWMVLEQMKKNWGL